MSDIAIRVESLSKLYRIGIQRARYKTIREGLSEAVATPFRRVLSAFQHSSPPASQPLNGGNTIWALKDVSFEVKQGEVMGIIGRNGAGKSTLLKVLSRITKPTQGRAEIHGRVGSLLEVGTGFHPELTGRENMYLNGAILGMKKAELERKFDEIVAFAEVEQFIDTPVKRYSSGMYVRLAFAVAAHLEPEILLVDEVLAVGDAEFQKKCLGKMGDVARVGRTILFVSHNMQAIQSLCTSAMQLDRGRITRIGEPRAVVAHYLASIDRVASEVTWPEETAPGDQQVKLLGVRVFGPPPNTGGTCSSRDDVTVELDFVAHSSSPGLCVGFDLITSEGVLVARSYHTDLPPERWPHVRLGKNRWCCTIPRGLLNAGVYFLSPRIGIHNMYWIIHLDPVIRFEVVLDHGVSPFWNVLDARNRPGVIAPILQWESRN
jgi:lipopolysaccharide transport system ATP-binding protein